MSGISTRSKGQPVFTHDEESVYEQIRSGRRRAQPSVRREDARGVRPRVGESALPSPHRRVRSAPPPRQRREPQSAQVRPLRFSPREEALYRRTLQRIQQGRDGVARVTRRRRDVAQPQAEPEAAQAEPEPAQAEPDVSRYGRVMRVLREWRIITPFGDGQRVNLDLFERVWQDVQNGTMRESNAFTQMIKRMIPTPLTPKNIITLQKGSDNSLYLDIPLGSNLEVSTSLFLYLLKFLASLVRGMRYHIASGTGDEPTLLIEGDIGITADGMVNFVDVMRIYLKTYEKFRDFWDAKSVEGDDIWMDTPGSGEVFKLSRLDRVLKFGYRQTAAFTWGIGASWHPIIGRLIEEVFPHGGLVSVTNDTDNLCLLYTLAMGVAWCCMHNFFARDRTIDVNRLSKRIEQCGNMGMVNAKEIMRRIRTRTGDDACSDLESKVLRNLSTSDACKALEIVEEEFLRPVFALDVYMLDISDSFAKHLYPCYISRRVGGQRISIVNIAFQRRSHYCLITNLPEVYKNTGGKLFFTCSKCHRTYYSKQMEVQHTNCLSGGSGWSWSKYGTPEYARSFGECEKCHLKFEDSERYEFHTRHCFMKHRSGSRYVRLSDEPILKGGGEVEILSSRHIIFADFECIIKEDGEHEFMSYGWYDPESGEYRSGFSMEQFILEMEREVVLRGGELKVFFHNAMNYDVNFILQYVLKERRNWSINVIMKSTSRIQSIGFMYGENGKRKKLSIGDTFHFMTMSLAKIVNSIRKDSVDENIKNFPHFFRIFQRNYKLPIEELDKVLHKNLYPYRFFTDHSKVSLDITELDDVFYPREDNLRYFSEGVTLNDLIENYPKYREISRTFGMQTVMDYHNLYLMCDVLEISDVFLKARESLHSTHSIDIAKYIGMPGASWAAFLKKNPKLELPLYRETRFAEFFSYMTRGGVTSAPLRYAKSDATHSILYLDVNGLYPYVMQQFKYPYGEMQWKVLDIDGDINGFLLNNYFKGLESLGKGACLCVDLIIPNRIKDRTDQFPFAPEHRVLRDCYFDGEGSMYPFLRRWSAANNGEVMQPFYGLVGTLYDKEKYGVHWKLLEWYINHGIIVQKVHFVVEFDEGDYLKSYVSLNIDIRNKRTDELGKMVYKLMGNSIYGKTFESPFNRGTYLIIREEDKIQGLLEEGNIASITPIGEGSYIVKVDAEEVVLDKPTYIGACVTEYAKLHMYRLFYDDLGRIFPNIELVYTDTDSFIIRLEHAAGMSPHELFEFIERESPGLIGGKGGQVKSETGEDIIDEVIALRSKLYAYKTKGGKIGKRAKGTTAAAQETELTWDVYKQALLELHAVPTHNVQFRRTAFHVKSVDLVKQSISVNDGKRFICEDGIHTHAWGYFS